MNPKKALICGVSGQDGAYLSKLLLDKGYSVVGTSRDAQTSSFSNLKRLGIYEQIALESLVPTDFRSTLQTISKVEPDEIYNLSGQSSVGLSFQQPVETLESIAHGTLNLLEVIRFLGAPIRFYQAGSGDCFGDHDQPSDEYTPFRPRSPYGVAKAAAHWEVVNYREAYQLFACNGILFNHESPLRPNRFVTKKIIATCCRIATGSGEKLALGNLEIYRDWGWAPEYVDAMWRMLQHAQPDDYVIATGETNSLRDFVVITLRLLGLEWDDHVETQSALFRPTEIMQSVGNSDKAHAVLGWKAETKLEGVIAKMIAAEQSAT